MNKGIRDTWCAALRSGEHKQSGAFKDKQGHCPLGVLALTQGWDFEVHQSKILMTKLNGSCLDSSRWPIVRGVNWPESDVAMKIIDMNGVRKPPNFNWFADWIEENIPAIPS